MYTLRLLAALWFLITLTTRQFAHPVHDQPLRIPSPTLTPSPHSTTAPLLCTAAGEWAVLIRRRLDQLLGAHPDVAGVTILAGTNDVIATLGGRLGGIGKLIESGV
jgi:hypothetical protein